jgi:hypothetical protein
MNHLFSRTVFKNRSAKSLGGIARKPRPIPAYRCSIDVTDLTDIFAVDSPNQVRRKLKISAQTVEPFWRYGRHKCERVGYIWYTF